MLFDYDSGPMGMIHAPIARLTLFDHDPGPSNVQINAIVIETINDRFHDVMTKQYLEEYVAHVNTMYKRKDRMKLSVMSPCQTASILTAESAMRSIWSYPLTQLFHAGPRLNVLQR